MINSTPTGAPGQWVLLSYRMPHEHLDLIAEEMTEARAAEYTAVLAEAGQAAALPAPERLRVMRRLRGELRRIHRRDYFPPPQRRAADRAVAGLHPDQNEQETA